MTRLVTVLPPRCSSLVLGRAVELPPGPDAIRLLASVDPEMLDEADRVEHLVAWERCARWVEAQRARAVVAVAGREPKDRDDFDRELVRVALVGCGGSARSNVDLARALAGPLRAARDALERGEISYTHAKILTDETITLDDAAAAQVAEAALASGPRRSPGEFRRIVRRAIIAADPVRAELAAQRAARTRMVSPEVRPDAQAALFVSGPAIDVQTIWTALNATARALDGQGDDRTLDQRRFDALVQLCRRALAGPDAPRGRPGAPTTVYLFADLPTWVGLADCPVELDGYGPIPPGVARDHLSDARWRALVVDAVSGAALAAADRSYRPSAATTRLLHARDRRCGFPGCAAAAQFCDADHNRPYDAGGCTDADNCGLLCRRHHRLKTFTTWTWRRTADGGVEWTDPHGHTWSRDPIHYRLPDPDPDDEDDQTTVLADGADPDPPSPAERSPSPPPAQVPVPDDLGDPPF